MKSLKYAGFVLAALSSFALAACSDDGSSGSGGSGASGTADVIYEAEATDEALEALLAAAPVDNADEAAYLTSPVEGDVLAKSSAPTFAWRVGPEATGALFAPAPEPGPAPTEAERPSSDPDAPIATRPQPVG